MKFKSQIAKNPFLSLIAKISEEKKIESYVIGGYVRDLILDRKPSSRQDIDFVCVGSGIEFAKSVQSGIEGSNLTVFKNFGTAMVKIRNTELQFVGARKESYRHTSRKPIVEDGTLEDDLNRRDFTINAMAISLNKENIGELLDPFDGLKDLKKKLIRTPLDPDITFSDDPLRMMRAIRFSAQLKFDIDAGTFESIIRNCERIKIVSQERITDELNKIVQSDYPGYGFNLLYESGLLKIIFPEMVELHGVETINNQSHKDNFYHTLKVLDNVAKVSDDLWLRWAAILHDIAKPATKKFDPKIGWTFHGHEDKGARMVPGIFRKLKLPLNEPLKKVKKLVRLHLRPISLVKDHITDSAIRRLLFEAGDDLESLMKLCRADITSKNNEKVKKYLGNFDKVEKKMLEVEKQDKIRNFQPPVSGKEIMEIFGINPSKDVGEIKDEIKEAILEGRIKNNYEEAFQFMIKLGKKKGLTPIKNFVKY